MALQRIPHSTLMEILLKLDLQTLCSVACVSKTLQFAVVEAISLLSTLHLPIILKLSRLAFLVGAEA